MSDAARRALGFGAAKASPWIAAAAGIAVLCLVFRPEIAAAISVWNSSTAYGHCGLVLPIVAWLLWERRGILARQSPHPALWPAALALPLAAIWVAADWLGIMEGRQLAAIGMVLVLLLAVLGWRMWWALSAALLYLVFLVPFGAFLTPFLQHFTAGFIVCGLRVLDIPFEASAFQITIPEGNFFVAEACAGLRFLIASVAFGTLFAVTMFRSPARRVAFIAVSIAVPIVANGVRGLGIVLLGHAMGSAEAGAADHLIYGWVFFSIVILLLALAGLGFRQPMASPASPDPAASAPGPAWRGVLACLPVLLVAALAPVLAGRVKSGPAPEALPQASIVPPPGCNAGASSLDGARRTAEFQCGEQRVRIITTALPHGADPARVLDAARLPALAGLGGDIDTQAWTARPGAPPWMLVSARDTGRLAAYAIEVQGGQGVGGLHDRLLLVREMFGADERDQPVARTVTLAPGGADADALLKAFLQAAPIAAPALAELARNVP